MKPKQLINFLGIFLLTVSSIVGQNLIPNPADLVSNGELFTLNKDTKILYASDDLMPMANLLAELLSPATGWDFDLEKSTKKQANSIALNLNAETAEKEFYFLEVLNNTIEINANTNAGIFNASQTLLQLMPNNIYNKRRQKNVNWTVQGVQIKDQPLYPWRGVMLDVSRYFYDKEYVLHLIDIMGMYKLNVLHLHLIDDAGWRLEIKKYPKLTEIGAWRGEGANRTGGYFTQEEIKEIVSYAALRNVEVIPEIEVPAHTLAALAAYPELSCTGAHQIVPTKHFISRDLYCVGRESTFEFLENVFKETVALFPSKYIHIGGDEAKYDRWAKCTHCQKRKKDLGLETEAELQVYFTRRIQKMLKKYGKTIVGWDEMIEPGLTEKAVGMVWHDTKKAAIATKDGHDVVMALTGHCYFDVAESKIPGEVKAATWLPPISLEKVYQLDPMVEGIAKEDANKVLGGHATLWSDQFIHGDLLKEIALLNENRSEQYFDYLSLPRMGALAEVLWTPKNKQGWVGFEKRMATHYNKYNHAGYGYRVPQPKLISKVSEKGGYKISLKNVVNGAEVVFTTNGILPNIHSKKYETPVVVSDLKDFQAITVVSARQYSLPLRFPSKYEDYAKLGVLIKEWKSTDIKHLDWADLNLNATGKVTKNGKYKITIKQIKGEATIQIAGISVYKNGTKITEDIHKGSTGKRSNKNTYVFSINEYETGASFTIKARVKKDKKATSEGAIFMKQ